MNVRERPLIVTPASSIGLRFLTRLRVCKRSSHRRASASALKRPTHSRPSDDRCSRITLTPDAPVVDDQNDFIGLLRESNVRRALEVGKDLSWLDVTHFHVAGPC